MPQVTRVGDQGAGICNAHKNPRPCTVTFTEGSFVMSLDGRQLMCVGSKGVTDCGHNTVATTGSEFVTVRGLGVHRVGDAGVIVEGGSYTATTGMPGTNCI